MVLICTLVINIMIEGLTSRLLMKQYVDIKPPYRKVALSLEKCSNTLNKSIFHVIKIPEKSTSMFNAAPARELGYSLLINIVEEMFVLNDNTINNNL
uniref:Uncharacterized protein n=2 Tax=Anguilla anguilla TaxID=7936 RepID=A0A0E9QUW5_ANGAN